MCSKSTYVISDSQNPSAPQDTPLYAIFENGEWHFVDQELWDILTLRSQEYAFTCETCEQPLADCECGS